MENELCYFNDKAFDEYQAQIAHRYNQLDAIEIIKRKSSEVRNQNRIGLRCSQCHWPVFIKLSPKGKYHAAHYGQKKGEEILQRCAYDKPNDAIDWADCTYRNVGESNTSPSTIYNGENLRHNEYVRYVHESLLNDPLATEVLREKQIRAAWNTRDYRKPDVQAIIGGQRVAFELQISWLSPDDITAREEFYRRMGIKLIWLFPDPNVEKITVEEYEDANDNANENDDFKAFNASSRRSILIGSYLVGAGRGALLLYVDKNRPTTEGFKARFLYEPYIKVGDDVILTGATTNAERYININDNDTLGLEDLIFYDDNVLPHWWAYDTIGKITGYFASHDDKRLRVIKQKNDINALDIIVIKPLLEPYIADAQTEEEKKTAILANVLLKLLVRYVAFKNDNF